jgi:ATP-binding cassette subfamily F protein uup
MAAPLLLLRDIHLTFGGTPLLEGADLGVGEGDRLCLVGRNGSGKSTLLKIAAGLVTPDRGERDVRQGTSIRYLPQEPDLGDYATTLAYVEGGLGELDDAYRALYLLNQLGLNGDEAPGRLSGGEIRRCALARALAPSPDILLLDEPTNHLDLPLIEWLETELKSQRAAIVMISHDRRFLSNLSKTTVWLDRGTTRRLGEGFAAFEAWRDEVLEQEETQQHKVDRKIAAEMDWLRHGVSGRRKRNQRRLGALHTLRQERREFRGATGAVAMTLTDTEMSAKLVIEAKNVSKAYGAREIVSGFSTRIGRGDRVGIVGANGTGKTTLLNLLTGILAPDSGSVRIADGLEMVTLEQSRQSLDPTTPLCDVLTGGHGDQVMVGGQPRHVIGYMKDFLFSPEQVRTPVGVLSGGERARLMLARALARPSSLLVLDEPTNDLDLETLDLLQEMIGDYGGTVLLVSHDRDFLDRTVTTLIVSEENSQWGTYAGGYSDMIAQRGQGVTARTTTVAAAPKAAKEPTKAPTSQPKRKLNFKEQHDLQTLPARIAELESQITKLKTELAVADLFTRKPDRFNAAVAELSKAEAALADAEDRWLAAEMAREALEE